MPTDNPSMPWSLVGISDDARKAVRVAAAESDQTIGQWLNDRILRAASQVDSATMPATNTAPGHTRAAHDILARMDMILADAEQYSAQALESYRTTLEQLTRRVYDLERTDNIG